MPVRFHLGKERSVSDLAAKLYETRSALPRKGVLGPTPMKILKKTANGCIL